MKLLLLLTMLGLMYSCSSVHDSKTLAKRIQAEEVRSLNEIKYHAGLLLESHPELNDQTKNEISHLLKVTIEKQQLLKDEESKIFQLLLRDSLRINQLSDSEIKSKNDLKLKLNKVYKDKSKNVLTLIKKIVNLSKLNVINDNFRSDMFEMIRDFR